MYGLIYIWSQPPLNISATVIDEGSYRAVDVWRDDKFAKWIAKEKFIIASMFKKDANQTSSKLIETVSFPEKSISGYQTIESVNADENAGIVCCESNKFEGLKDNITGRSPSIDITATKKKHR